MNPILPLKIKESQTLNLEPAYLQKFLKYTGEKKLKPWNWRVWIVLGGLIFEFSPGATNVFSQKVLTIKDYVQLSYPLGQLSCTANESESAFVVKSCDKPRNKFIQQVWTCALKAPFSEPRILFPEFDFSYQPQFSPSPDVKVLAFLAVEKNADSSAAIKFRQYPQLFISLENQAPQNISQMPFGVESFIWSAEGKLIFFLAQHALSNEEIEQWNARKLSGDDAYIFEQPVLKNEIWLIDLETRQRECIFSGDYGLKDLEISPDGEMLAFSTNYTGIDDDRNYDLWLMPIGTRQAFQLTDSPDFERSPRFSPDSRYLACLTQTDGSFQLEISLISLSGGRPDVLTGDFDENIAAFGWNSDGSKIIFTAQVKTGQKLFSIDLKNKKVTPVIDFPEQVFCRDFAVLASGDLCFLKETAVTLPEICLFTTKKTPTTLTHFSKQLNDFSLSASEKFSWNSEGESVEGILIRPVNKNLKLPFPLVVVLHGGPFGSFYERLVNNEYLQLYAQQGFLVFAPNPAGSAGYGAEFARKIRLDVGGKDFDQILSGIDKLVQKGLADSSRMALVGGSYGGYLVNWIISQTPRFKAAVSLYGIFNFISDYGTSQRSSWQKIFLGDYYWNDFKIYRRRSPAFFVQHIRTPLLLLHGEDDRNTNPGNSLETYRALKTLQRPVELVLYPREGHGINREPNHEIDKVNRILDWIGK